MVRGADDQVVHPVPIKITTGHSVAEVAAHVGTFRFRAVVVWRREWV